MRCPLVIVTGFLGAGKTTLVNRLLARRAERGARGKLGVIVNELGEIGIDGALLAGGARQVELPGGCVCCVLGEDLDRTLLEMIADNPGLEAIVLETTGVAEPLPIAWAVRREPVASAVRLAMVVALVDATHLGEALGASEAARGQIAYSDVLLVTKAEIAGAEATAGVIAAAGEIAPRALVLTGTTDAHAIWLEHVLVDPEVEHVPADPRSREDGHGHDHEHGHGHHGHGHHGIDTIALEIPRAIDLEELEDQLAALPASYVRIKGIAATDRGWAAFHRVGLRVSSEPLPGAPTGFGGNRGRIVALGHELRREQLAACVEAALV